MTEQENTTIYLCADATLTYGPYGGMDKIIPQALPVCRVRDPEEAERIITLVGSMDYGSVADPNYGGKEIKEGYGPPIRHRYSLENNRRGDVECLAEVGKTLEAMRDALRVGDREAFHRAWEESKKGLGLTAPPTYGRGEGNGS